MTKTEIVGIIVAVINSLLLCGMTFCVLWAIWSEDKALCDRLGNSAVLYALMTLILTLTGMWRMWR